MLKYVKYALKLGVGCGFGFVFFSNSAFHIYRKLDDSST